MRLHEYEAKEIFSEIGIPVPKGGVARSREQASEIAERLDGPAVVKAQVLVGGRGKAGGIRFGEGAGEVGEITQELLGAEIRGCRAEAVLVEERIEAEQEIYLGVTVDGEAGAPVAMVSSEGGVSVEELAARSPEKIHTAHADVFRGLPMYEARRLVKRAGLRESTMVRCASALARLYDAFGRYGALIAEINPLMVRDDGDVVAADAVLEIDDDALRRYPQFQRHAEDRIDDPLEREAKRLGVSYVGLDGDIGIICSGAGLGMATMDLIRARGGPANFLETGGGVTAALMAGALRIVLKRPNVRGVFINIYGGINPIHEGAKGIAEVIETDRVEIPIVAKALGNFQEETWAILEEAGVEVVRTVRTDRAVAALFDRLDTD